MPEPIRETVAVIKRGRPAGSANASNRSRRNCRSERSELGRHLHAATLAETGGTAGARNFFGGAHPIRTSYIYYPRKIAVAWDFDHMVACRTCTGPPEGSPGGPGHPSQLQSQHTPHVRRNAVLRGARGRATASLLPSLVRLDQPVPHAPLVHDPRPCADRGQLPPKARGMASRVRVRPRRRSVVPHLPLNVS